MKLRISDVRQIWLGCILLLNALSSSAVTLGRHSGAAIIGRPLDIRVQALMSTGEDMSSQCFSADVFYGDMRVSTGQVRSIPSVGGSATEADLRVQSSLPVNEPVVTVYVRAGCNAPFTRRYVLLADPLTESSTPAPLLPAAAVPVVPAGENASATRPGGPPAARVAVATDASAGQSPVDRPVPTQTSPTPRLVTPAVVRRSPQRPPESAARLRLDPLDVSLPIERDPTLKLTLDLLTQPATSDEARAAAGMLWRSINATPEEVLRDAQRLAQLEAEAASRRAGEAQARATLAELSGRLAQAESGRYLNGLVYALSAALLLALGAAMLLWRRLKSSGGETQAGAWWEAQAAEAPPQVAHAHDALGLTPLDLDLSVGSDSAFGEFRPLSASHQLEDSLPSGPQAMPPLSRRDRADFAPSLIGAARSVATEELFDVQQQADFFISLGEDEQAIRVLRNHLADSAEPSALAYLDLLKLYHRMGRREDYDRARIEFNQVFNAGAPPFDQYTDDSLGLEAYETAFGRIQALWPQPRVLDVIEQSIFRDPRDPDAEVFDLEAYRELLLLHAMAKDMIQRDEAAAAPASDFQHTTVQPLKAAAKGGVGTAAAGLAAVGDTVPVDLQFQMFATAPNVGALGALDVDLSEISEFSAFEASLPEVLTKVEPTAQPAGQLDGLGEGLDGSLIDFSVLDFTTAEEPSVPLKSEPRT